MIKELFFLVIYLVSFGVACSAFSLKLVFFLRDRKSLWKLNLLIFISFMVLLSFLVSFSFYVKLLLNSESASLFVLVLNVFQALFYSLLFFVVPNSFKQLLSLPIKVSSQVVFVLSSFIFFTIYLVAVLNGGNAFLLVGIKAYLLLFLYIVIFFSWKHISALPTKRMQKSMRAILILSILFLPFVTFEKLFFPSFFHGSILNSFEAPFFAIYLFWMALIDLFYLVPSLTGGCIAVLLDEHREKLKDAFGISDREWEVILAVENGDASKQIAYKLNISLNTVNNHLANLYKKTATSNRVQLLNRLRSNID